MSVRARFLLLLGLRWLPVGLTIPNWPDGITKYSS